ncbi:unnamed protein product [Ectocarpus sp. 6 AP-2014]
MLLSGTWCLALAGGSATLSDLTWEAMNKEIRNMEEETARRDDEKRFKQLRRSAQEANALCTIFACVCTGYGGYALSFTVALGLGANVTSTYLLVAGGYLLLLAGAVGAWAARSGRPDAFRIHFGALLPAGALYASLTVVQLVSVGPSDRRVTQAWDNLHAEGESLYSVQTKVGTMLIVSGVLSVVTFALVVCAAVASRAARNALLHLPESSPHRHRRQGKLSRGERLAVAWALALAATSTFIDGSFAVFSAWLARDGEQAGVWLLAIWEGMGRGDGRYVDGDTFIVSTAIIVATIVGPGAMLYAWAVYCRKGYRFSVGILVCAASLHTQLLRYVTSADSSESSAEPGSKAFFIAASVVLALLQVAGALAVLIFNVGRMTKRVHAAEVHYRALLLEHGRLSDKIETRHEGDGGEGAVGGPEQRGGALRKRKKDGDGTAATLGGTRRGTRST